MNECITNVTCHFTPAASLAALEVKLQQLNVFEPIHRLVHIAQKTVNPPPATSSLMASFLCWQERMAWSKSIRA